MLVPKTTNQREPNKTVIALEFSYTARIRTRNRKEVALVAAMAEISPILNNVSQ